MKHACVGKTQRLSLAAAVASICAGLAAGCSVTETVYLQDIEITGPINQPPVHVTRNVEPDALTLSPHVSIGATRRINAHVEGHSRVNAAGVFQVDTLHNSDGTLSLSEPAGMNIYEYSGENLHWDIPSAQVGLDVNLALSRGAAITGGIRYASSDNQSSLSGHAGFALLSEKERSGVRFEGGVLFNASSYEVSSLVVTQSSILNSSSTYIMFYRDRNERTSVNPYGTFTFNTNNPEWTVNIFFQGSVSWQTLYDFTPSQRSIGGPFSEINTHDLRGEHTSAIFGVTPGLYIDAGSSGRFLAGVRVLKYDIEDQLALIPMVQVDFTW